jgi:hypothetical protein
MNHKHTFKISSHRISHEFDPSVAPRGIQRFWRVEEYVNGEFQQLWGPYDSENEAELAANRLTAHFSLSERGSGP